MVIYFENDIGLILCPTSCRSRLTLQQQHSKQNVHFHDSVIINLPECLKQRAQHLIPVSR